VGNFRGSENEKRKGPQPKAAAHLHHSSKPQT